MAIDKVKMKLQGHEKFPLREGWLTKGLMTVKKEPDVFLDKNATDIFGIGSNMVKSLRYWMRAFGLTDEKEKGLSELGMLINKYDIYIEDVFTVWLLHSQIAKNIENATAWYMFFNRFNMDEFTKEQAETILVREVTKYSEGQAFSTQSLKNDIDVILNMYGKNRAYIDPEEKSTSPFAQLGLIKKNDNRFVKSHPDRRGVPDDIILYELALLFSDADSISIESLISGEKSVAYIYHLPAMAINEILDKLDSLGYIRVNRTAGLDVVYKVTDFSDKTVIENYYKNSKR